MKELNRHSGWYEIRKRQIKAEEKRNRDAIKRAFKKEYAKFARFIKWIRYQNLRKIDNPSYIEFNEYHNICRKFTELTIQKESIDITGREFTGINIDHIMPIKYGWLHQLSPYLLGMSCNLQRLTSDDNREKGSRYKLLN